METEIKRIETLEEVKSYIAKLKYAINNGAKIEFQAKRKVDEERDIKYTNKYTIATLFPDENPVEALKRELLTLTAEEYLCTVKDIAYPQRSEMRVFGKTYQASEEVYIKIRVELANPNNYGNHTTFVMSFHFAEIPFSKQVLPYKKSN